MNAVASDFLNTDTVVCEERIRLLVETHSAIRGALVSTVDGFEVAARLPDSVSSAKLSAMASSLVALAEAVSSESGGGECHDLVIDANACRVLLMDIARADQKLLLTVICDTDETLGQVLWAVRKCRDEIRTRLRDA
jgi:predicted regulator of Ras-like GTPase activity (Roadblock/LC7/MglB family)